MSCGQQLGPVKYCESQWKYENVRNHSLHRSILEWFWHSDLLSQIPIEIVARDTPRLKWQPTSIPTIYVAQNESEIEQETAQYSHTIFQQQNIDCDATAWQPFCTCCPNKNTNQVQMSKSDSETGPTNWMRGNGHVCSQNDPLWLEMVLTPLPMLPNGDRPLDPNWSESAHIGPFLPIWGMKPTLRTQMSLNWRLPQSLPLLLDRSRRIASFCEYKQIGSDMQSANNHNCTIPESRRLAWMEFVQWFCLLTSWSAVLQQTIKFLCNLCDTREVNTSLLLRPLHNSQLQSYGTTYVFNQFWNQILISTWYFNSIFSIHHQWSTTPSPSQQSNAPLCVIPTAGFIFFLKGPP